MYETKHEHIEMPVCWCPMCRNPLYPTKKTSKFIDLLDDAYNPELVEYICTVCRWTNKEKNNADEG